MTTNALGYFPLPPTFPEAEFDFVNDRVALRTRTKGGSPIEAAHVSAWGGFGTAWRGVAYRQRAAHEHASRFVASIQKSSAPPTPERYAQDHELFGFFCSAASAIEMFHFAMNCAGAVVWPNEFPLDDDKKLKVYPQNVRARFERQTPGEPLSKVMLGLESNSDLGFINDMRRVLFHRGSPPRQHFFSTERAHERPSAMPLNMKDAADAWHYGFDLVPDCLAQYEAALDSAVRELVIAADDFARRHL